MKQILIAFMLLAFSNVVVAQDDLQTLDAAIKKAFENKWYERIQLRGYAQFRYNRLFETNRDLKCRQCDRSIGDKQGFFLRRARLVFFGDVTDRLSFYVQPDMAQQTGDRQNFFQIRDLYFDYFLEASKQLRIRAGISKVTYGFENMQSSSNRLALDRSDAINSAAPNERDTGAYILWNSENGKKILKEMTQNNLKGTGDYGMVAFGAYNGQTLNIEEKNNGLHTVMRLALPYKSEGGQFYEASVQGYTGKFNIAGKDFVDQREAVAFVMFPQPIGFQVEWNTGLGPEYNSRLGRVTVDELEGGYAQIMYQTTVETTRWHPYVRYQTYQGGKKIESGTRHDMTEWEFGTEISPNPYFELTLAYAVSDRQTWGGDLGDSDQQGNLMRVQAQVNF